MRWNAYKVLRSAVLALSVLTTVITVAGAQRTTTPSADGGIEIVVTDFTGAVIPKADVVLANRNGERAGEGVTTEYGRFQSSNLAGDAYVLTVMHPGFLTNTQDVSVTPHRLIRVATVLQWDGQPSIVNLGGPHRPLLLEVQPGTSTILYGFSFDLCRRSRPTISDVETACPNQPARK